VPPIVDEHVRRNRTTSDLWTIMAPHRAQVTRLISEARGPAAQTLCVLGAGNANDIDLVQLAAEFDRISLVDLDSTALERACERLTPDARAKIDLQNGIDLTGILPTLSAWPADTPPSLTELTTAINAARNSPAPLSGQFDVVASTCVLTQLIDSVCMAVKTDSAERNELILAVRNRHLQLMVELLAPNGAGVLVTDFVATETAPELAFIADSAVPAAAIEWINRRNFFTGANPYAISGQLQNQNPVGNIQVSPAWRWDIGAKQLAVSAITFRRNN
jgi:hypothetical protein